MKIVTVGREFSSGGRELGKRLADVLGFAYYDREIICKIAENTKLDENYIASRFENGFSLDFGISYGRTFAYPVFSQQNDIKILVAERNIISEIASKGEDFVIVGRNSDVILKSYNPFNIFVYSDMDSKIKRCRIRLKDGDQMTDRQIMKKIKQIDSGRSKHRELLASGKWGKKENYHLCVNTSGMEIKSLVPHVAGVADCWFERNSK